ncbi:unnamed protein product [Schistosoma rodhaini]|uniref:Tubulin--tyrosine ligase-like protein 9 n=1 Tax=Schistosoma rodhaini TaxID=6188 RepID=A0AA85GCE4_9TREM|nr:unnamed protein product [Schistosoma rodhaini]CAH8624487.1 unnamed protein product [Schistosoma rodhaini]
MLDKGDSSIKNQINSTSLSNYDSKNEWKCGGNTKLLHNSNYLKIIRERKKNKIKANLRDSRYNIVDQCIREAGFTVINNDDINDAYLIWSDNFLSLERIMKLEPYQRANHFPGMIEICRKDLLTKNFSRMQKAKPDEYNFMPNTWILPQEYGYFSNYARKLYRQGCNPCFIQKPANGAMGHGIHLYCDMNKISGNINDGIISVIQEYIEHPLLIDGYKCDLRVYVLVTSCDPLKIFIYNEGLVRLSAEKYIKPSEPNGDSIYRQLTNYSINKHHIEYHRSPDDISGSKRSFTFFNHYIQKVKQSNPYIIWDKIYDLIIKTIIIALPHLMHFYRISRHQSSNQNHTTTTNNNSSNNSNNNKHSSKQSGYHQGKQYSTMNNKQSMLNNHPKQSSKTMSTLTSFIPSTIHKSKVFNMNSNKTSFMYSNLFEILGFDILIDEQLNPWLIEVNRSPSFNIDQQLDKQIKYNLLTDTIRLLNIRPSDKSRVEKQQKLTTRKRLYNSHSVQTQNWMYKSDLNIRNDKIHKHIDKNRSSIKKHTNHELFHRDNVNLKTNHQSPFAYQLDIDYLKLMNDQDQMEGKKLSLKIDHLKQQLHGIRQQLSMEFYEHHNCGNWHRIFPSNNSKLQTKYASLIMTSFKQFLHSNQNDLLNEIKTTYLNPITEDDIYDELSKLIKQESKLKPGINVEQYLTSVWSHCVDIRDTSDNNDSSSLEDDDIHNGGNFVHNNLNENYHSSYTKHNENSTNRIYLQNDYFIKSSIDRKMKSMPTLSILPPSNHMHFNGANLKLNSAPVSPCKFLSNENRNVTKQMIDKLSLGKKWKSLDIERNLKHANKRIQTNDNNNNTIAQVSFRPTNQNSGHDNTQLVGDIGDNQSSMGYVDSTNKHLSCTTRSDQKKASNSKSIANIKLGKHEMNVLLDFNDITNNLHNFKLSSSHLINNKDDYLYKSSMNDQFIPKQLCLLPIIHWNYCTLNEIVPSLFKKQFNQSIIISSIKQQLINYLNKFENMIKNQINLINYYLLINLFNNQLSNKSMYFNKLDQLNSRSLNKEDLLDYFNVQCFNKKRMIIYQHDEWIQLMIQNCLNSLNLMKIKIQLEGDYLPNEDICKQFENGLMNKFIRGLRITRLLNRIKSRLLINHGYLLKSIIQMIPNLSIVNETIMEMPMKYLLTEPLLNVEELCCKHFLRLCIESFILDYLKYLDGLIKTTDNNEDSIHFKKIT